MTRSWAIMKMSRAVGTHSHLSLLVTLPKTPADMSVFLRLILELINSFIHSLIAQNLELNKHLLHTVVGNRNTKKVELLLVPTRIYSLKVEICI